MFCVFMVNICTVFGLVLADFQFRKSNSRMKGNRIMKRATRELNRENNTSGGKKVNWEEALKSVTRERDRREILFDPHVLQHLHLEGQKLEIVGEFVNYDSDMEKSRQIDLVRRIAQKKLKGLSRYCILMVLMTGAGPKRLSELLGVSQSVVNRAIQRGARIIRNCLSETLGDFPVAKGARPPVRASIFPLDTLKERERFQTFLNENTVVHVSYRGDDAFREVMAVYLTGKAAKR